VPGIAGADGVWTIDGDVAKGGRIVVEGRMKSGRQQIVYLSRQARALFERVLGECANQHYVFRLHRYRCCRFPA
jgi:hypothetical protein